jgi:hypothetical protein
MWWAVLQMTVLAFVCVLVKFQLLYVEEAFQLNLTVFSLYSSFSRVHD